MLARFFFAIVLLFLASHFLPTPYFATPQDRKFVVVVTGTASGLGRSLVEALLSIESVFVVSTVRNSQDCNWTHARLACIPIDLEIDSNFSIILSTIKKTNLPVFGVINNAGIGMAPSTILRTPPDIYRSAVKKVFSVNFFAPAHLTSTLLPLLKEGASKLGSARIVNIGSLMGLIALPRCGGYCGSKFAIEALTSDWRYELEKERISVSLVEPGAFKSKMCEKCTQSSTDSCTNAVLDAVFSERPLSRYFCADIFGIPSKIVVAVASLVPQRLLDSILRFFESIDSEKLLPRDA